MVRYLVFLVSLFFSTTLLACPYCAGSSQSGKDSNTTLVLALFILAIYIPYYLIFRMIKKQKALALAVKEAHDNPGSANS